ncbi:hypothetical protein L9F63_019583, partial [Diploptera punctata]
TGYKSSFCGRPGHVVLSSVSVVGYIFFQNLHQVDHCAEPIKDLFVNRKVWVKPE